MGRTRCDNRRRQSSLPSTRQSKRRGIVKYHNYKIKSNNNKLKTALVCASNSGEIRTVAQRFQIPKSTLYNRLKKLRSTGGDVNEIYDNNVSTCNDRLTLLNTAEEEAVEQYCLWQSDRGMNVSNKHVKALVREIHYRAVESGEKRQPLNSTDGPSAKYMRSFYKRHPKLTYRSSERVDRGRINMASAETVTEYFDILRSALVKNGIMTLNEDGTPNQETIKTERIYLADETGWGVNTKTKKVIARKGSKHVYNRKPNDESHKTLMLGICGNGDVLKSLIILEKSFPLLAEGESDHIPENILISKSDKGSMDQQLFCDWLEQSVIPHKLHVNPDDVSYLVLDNHSSRFSLRAIDLCIEHNIEMICYPGHLTHILQGPDVVLNKPISTQVENMVYSNPIISGNSDLSRVAFMAIIDQAVKTVCTEAAVKMAFSATGIIPFDPKKIDLTRFPSSRPTQVEASIESPVKATCTECRSKNVDLHPLVRQGLIPKKIAEVFTYTPPPQKPKTKSKIVKSSRIITSEEVRAEVKEIEKKKKEKILKVKISVPRKKKEKKLGKTMLKKLLKEAEEDNSESEASSSEGEQEESSQVSNKRGVVKRVVRKRIRSVLESSGSEESDCSTMNDDQADDVEFNKESDTEDRNSEDKFEVNMNVVIEYEMELFPGKVTAILPRGLVVSCMEKGISTGSTWRWPSRKDEKAYPFSDIKMTNVSLNLLPGTSRNVEFHVPELDYIWGNPFAKYIA